MPDQPILGYIDLNDLKEYNQTTWGLPIYPTPESLNFHKPCALIKCGIAQIEIKIIQIIHEPRT